MSKALTTAFTYDLVDKDAKNKLIYLAGQVKKARASHQRTGLEIGESVAEAHAILAGDGRDGSFAGWVQAECGFSRETAYKYLRAWQKFGESPSIDQYEVSALHMLSGPSVPPEAVKEAERQARKGPVTSELAKEILGKFKSIVKKSGRPARTKRSVNLVDTSAASAEEKSTNDDGKSAGEQVGEPASDKDYGKCPNCASEKWTDDGFGVDCAKCRHPYGEPTGEVDDQRVTDARSKTIKTAEALMRAVDDLNLLCPKAGSHKQAIDMCKAILTTARDWR